jgi:hypothetical protein
MATMRSCSVRLVVLLCACAALFAATAVVSMAAASVKLKVTTSQYEHTVSPAVLNQQGCNAGKAKKTGIVILDFGRPAFKNGVYGTLLFSGDFAWNGPINQAVEAYISGYMQCRPNTLKGMLSVARGTNDSCTNEDPNCCPNTCSIEPPSFTKAGYSWAVRTNQVEKWIMNHSWRYKVRATAAIDAEPAWDPAYTATSHFVSGFDQPALHSGWKLAPRLWDFGSAETGYWTQEQLRIVAAGGSGINHVMPEIYYPGMAREWSDLSLYSVGAGHGRVSFGGVTSQWAAHQPKCGYRPVKSRNQLLIALALQKSTTQGSIAQATDFPCAAPGSASSVTPATAAAVTRPPNVYGRNGVPCRSIVAC